MASYRPFPPQSSQNPIAGHQPQPPPPPPPQQPPRANHHFNPNWGSAYAASADPSTSFPQMPPNSNYHHPNSHHVGYYPYPPPVAPPPPPPEPSYEPPPPPPPPPMYYPPNSQYNNQPPPPPPPPSSPPPPPPPTSPPPPPPPVTQNNDERRLHDRDKVPLKDPSTSGRREFEHSNHGGHRQHKPAVPHPGRKPNANAPHGRVETEEERRLRKKREYEKQRQEEKHRQQLKESQNTVLQKTQMLSSGKGHGSIAGSRMGERRATPLLSGDRIENRLKKPTTFLCKLK